jgi:hypothetical protein
MYYQQNLGVENEEREYKIVCFTPTDIDNKDKVENLKSGKWIYNNIIHTTIIRYLNTFLPKYIASFSHPKSNVKFGEFYLGVNDDGIVHGIPYEGELLIDFIENQLEIIFEKKIRSINNDCKTDYKQKMIVKLIKLYKEDYYDYIDYYNEYINNQEKEQIKLNQYLNLKKNWEKLFLKYVCKLHEIINDPLIRLELIDFIKERCKNKLLMLDLLVELRSNKQFNAVSYNYIEKYRNDVTNIFYWLTRFKDYRVSFLKSIKPINPKLYYNDTTPSYILSNIPNMIPYWLHKNKSLNIYLIKIIIPGNISENNFLQYKDNVTGEWLSSYRTSYKGQPRCIPLI